MKALMTLLGTLGMFFMVLNMFGGVVSGIWLAILGEWWAIGLGLLGLMVSTFVISIALLPQLALGGLAIALGSRSKAALLLVGLLASLYLVAVITVWCVGALYVFMSRADAQSWIPLLIWSYGAATGPWTYMASRENQDGRGEASVVTAFFAQVAYLVVVVVGIVADSPLASLATIFAAIMLVNVVIQLGLAYVAEGQQRAGA